MGAVTGDFGKVKLRFCEGMQLSRWGKRGGIFPQEPFPTKIFPTRTFSHKDFSHKTFLDEIFKSFQEGES
jgi:hypothetical protein